MTQQETYNNHHWYCDDCENKWAHPQKTPCPDCGSIDGVLNDDVIIRIPRKYQN